MHCSKSELDLDLGLNKLYKLESIGIRDSSTGCLDDLKVEEFNKSIILKDGHYFVDLPWHEELINRVPSNSNIALSTLKRVLNSLEQKQLYSQYNEIFEQQLKDGIIESFSVDPSHYNEYIWIPHRPVIKTLEQVTTKIRPVFNCSLKIGENPSLNEAAYPGVDLMNSLFSLLCQFRSNKYVLLSDVRQAFLQIRLKQNSDKNRFCFFWYHNNQLLTFRYNTIVFGLASSPFILNYVIKYHADKYPQDITSDVLKHNFYVDNLVFTHSESSCLREVYDTANTRMNEGGFTLRSWNTNHEELREVMIKEGKMVEHAENSERVLGYLYEFKSDKLRLI